MGACAGPHPTPLGPARHPQDGIERNHSQSTSFHPPLCWFIFTVRNQQVNRMKYKKRTQPLRIRNDSFKHWVVKSILVFELEKLGHEVELELHLPGIGYCDVVDQTVFIQYEIDGKRESTYRNGKARKYLRPGIRDVTQV